MLIVLALFCAAESNGAAGDLDPSFGNGGKVTTDFDATEDVAYTMAMDSSGRIILAGDMSAVTCCAGHFALARYTSAGVLDSSFGNGGKVTTDFDGKDSQIFAMAVDSAGRILAVGPVEDADDPVYTDFALARYTSTGALDPTFGSGGKVTTNFHGLFDVPRAVAIDASGRILVAGESGRQLIVARYTSAGVLDPSFGSGGSVTTTFFNHHDYGTDIAIDSAGRIVVTAQAVFPLTPGEQGQAQSHFAVARYTAAGVLDSSFGSGGKVTTYVAGHFANSMVIDSNGRIILAGGKSRGDFTAQESAFALVCYTASGVLDSSFGSGGKVLTDLTTGYDTIWSAVLDPAGGIVVAGAAAVLNTDPLDSNFAVARYTSNGTLDTSFGNGGSVITDFYGSHDTGHNVGLDATGKVVVGGFAKTSSDYGAANFALARYLTDAPGIALKIGATTTASGGSYNFAGEAPPGEERSITVTINNTGNAPLTGIAASTTPAGDQDFRVGSPPPPSSIAAGASATFPVIFSPQAAGNRTGTLQVASNAAPNPYIIQLSGTGADTVPPTITSQAENLTIVCDAAGNSTRVNDWLQAHGGATATDNFSAVTWSDNFAAMPPNCGSATVIFTVSDAAGNKATSTAQLIVLDQTPPTITKQAEGLSIACDASDRMNTVNAWLAAHGAAAATDNSGSVAWSHDFAALPAACAAVTVTFIATDPSGNSSTTAAQLISVDNKAPTITTVASGTTVESDGQGNTAALNAWLNNHGGASASDTCTAVTWSHNFNGLTNTLPQTVPVTFSATDACGNSTTTNASLVIRDTTPPEITAAAKDRYADCGQGGSQIDSFLASRGDAQAKDIAGPVTWTHNYDGTLPACEGYVTVTFTATDTVGLSVSTTARFFLFPPGAVWIGPATGSWQAATAWRSQVPTSALDAYVDLFDFQDSAVTVTTTNAATKNLAIGEGDTLTIGNGVSYSYLYVHGSSIRNAGILQLNAPGTSPYNYLWIHGPTALTGPGRLIFTGAGRNAIERGLNSSDDVLTVSEDHEITTSSDTIGDNQHSYIGVGLVNYGTVTADAGGLGFYTEPKTNHAIFGAINGGTLRMQAVINNIDGTLFADATSVLHLASTLNGGEVVGEGRLRMNSDANLNGPLTLGAGLNTSLDSAITTLTGTITNHGLFTIGTPEGTAFTQLSVNGAVTLEGAGKIRFQGGAQRLIDRASYAATDVLTVGADQEITTTSDTVAGDNNSAIVAGLVNHGIITADGGGLGFTATPKTNHGTFRAINGGTLRMQVIVNNAEGTLFAGAASVLHLQSTLNGGEVIGDGTLRMNSSNAAIDGPVMLGASLKTALDSAVATLTGTITNHGVLTIGTPTGTAFTQLSVNGAVTLQGTGKVVFQGGAQRLIDRASYAETDVLTVGAGQEITTSADTVAGSSNSAIIAGTINYGTITADKGGLALPVAAKTNHGTFRAINGGSLVITGSSLTNYSGVTSTLAGGRWEVVSTGDPTLIDIRDAPIAAIAGGTIVRLSGPEASLPQLSGLGNISGTLSLENGQTLSTTGNMAIPGVLQYGLPAALESTRLAITGNVDFTGTRIDVLDRGMTSGSYLLATWSGSSTGTPVLGSLPRWSQHHLVLDSVAKTLRLEITVVHPVNISGVSVQPGTGTDAGQNVVTMSAAGGPSTNYAVEASDDLVTWKTIAYVSSTPSGAVTLTINEPAWVTRQFYRLRVP